MADVAKARTMRIIFFSHYFPPEVNAPAARTYEHLVRWKQQGNEVTVITCAPNCPAGKLFDGYRNRFPYSRDHIDGIDIVRVWTIIAPNKGVFRRSLNYYSYLVMAFCVGMFVRRPNVIVATSPQFFCGCAGLLVAKLRRIPAVLEIRDIWPASIEAVGAFKNRLAFALLSFLEKRMYLWATRIVTVGQGYKDHIAARLKGRQAEKVDIIPNGVDLRQFQPQPPDPRFLREHGAEGKFVCSYVGTIGMAHGLDVVLRAAAELKAAGRDDIKFLIVGDGAERERLERQSAELDVGGWVKFLGILPKDKVPQVLASSNAVLVHLRGLKLFETVIPSKIFETMAMRRPIILGVGGGVRSMVESAKAGTHITPESAPELVRAITLWADDPSLAEQFGQAARSYVERHFDRDKLAADYLGLLRNVAGLTHPSPEPGLHGSPEKDAVPVD